MEIVMKNNKTVEFCTLHIGDVFMYNNLLFMKTEIFLNKNDDVVNAVRLDGKITSFVDEDVIPIDGKFIVD